MMSQHYVCERCGRPAVICHHKKYLNDKNFMDPSISLSFDNLEALCQDCHNKEHSLKRPLVLFNGNGEVKGCKESKDLKQYKSDREKMDNILGNSDTLRALQRRLMKSV